MADDCKDKERCDDIKKVMLIIDQHKREHAKLDTKVDDHDTLLKEMSEFQAGSKVYVGEILKKLENLENKMFVFMADTIKAMSETNNVETKTASKERQSAQEQWQKFAMDIIKLTVVAAIGYTLGGGQPPP